MMKTATFKLCNRRFILFLLLILLTTSIPRLCSALTAEDLKKHLTARELEQSEHELEEQFSTNNDETSLSGEDEEKLSYFRVSMAGKHQQLKKNAIFTAGLALAFLLLRKKMAAR